MATLHEAIDTRFNDINLQMLNLCGDENFVSYLL